MITASLCHVGSTAQHCRLGLFQDSHFAGDFEHTKSISVRESYVCSEVERLFPQVGCARNNRQYRTFLPNQKLFRWMLVEGWTGYLLLTYGMW